MNNFDLRKFLSENKLTPTSKVLGEIFSNTTPDYLAYDVSEMYAKNKQLVSNTNLMVFAGAIIIAFAILNLKN